MIDVQNLVMQFGQARVLDRVSFHVPRGAVYGLVGPAGAGKTTLLTILATLLKPTSGSVHVNGIRSDESPRTLRRSLGYVPDFFGLSRHLTVHEYLDFYAGACGLRAGQRRLRIAEVLELTRLGGRQQQVIESLSRSQKQRLCLAKAVVHKPSLLLLDDLFSGFDARVRGELGQVLGSLLEDEVTAVISARGFEDLDAICTHMGVLAQGRLLQSGTLAEVLEAARPRRTWVIQVQDTPGTVAPALLRFEGVAEVSVRETALVVRLDENALRRQGRRTDVLPAEVLRCILDSDVRVMSVNEERAELDDVLVVLTQGVTD